MLFITNLSKDHCKNTILEFIPTPTGKASIYFLLITGNEQPRRKQRGIKRKILNAPRGGELNLLKFRIRKIRNS